MNDWQKILASAFALEVETIGGGEQCLSRYTPCGAHILLTCLDGGGMPDANSWHIGVYSGEDWETAFPNGDADWQARSDCTEIDCAQGLRIAVERLTELSRNTDALATEYQGWCDARGLPELSADELWHEILGMIEEAKTDAERARLVEYRDAVKRFWDLWEKVEDAEDFEAAVERARG